MTVADIVTNIYRHDWRKHGPFPFENYENDYVERKLSELSPLEFLKAISDAIEDRIAEATVKKIT